MTFLEAAIAVLRQADEALHVREIAQRAVAEDLLSHVGRDPEAAMRSCLTSAVRSNRSRDGFRIVRVKPGYYAVEQDPAARSPEPEAGGESETPPSPAAVPERVRENAPADAEEGGAGAGPAPDEPPPAPSKDLAFRAPPEAGLSGVTDVALVMANAMSRIVARRPELKEEFEAMQKSISKRGAGSGGRTIETARGAKVEVQVTDRGSSRRRRRRRRKNKKVDWSAAFPDARGQDDPEANLLDAAAKVLAGADGRQVHIRQIAEALSSEGILQGDMSEIERAVTAAILADVRRRGAMSRFVARGDARYQLRAARLPEPAAAAEEALREAVGRIEREIEGHLAAWLGTLGHRALEAVVRMYLSSEGYGMVATLAPFKGTGRIVVEDPDLEGDAARTLVIVIPRKVGVDPRLWQDEPAKSGCERMLVVTGGAWPGSFDPPAPGRAMSAPDLAAWMRASGFGVETCTVQVTMIDPTIIESVAGLDS